MSLNSISSFRNLLRIEKHRLDDELEIQAELLHHIAENTVLAKSRAQSAKDELDRLEGTIYSEEKEASPKATVNELQSIVLNDADRIKAWQKYQLARHDQEAWEGLHEAWKSRGFALRALVDLRLASYYTSDSAADDGRKALHAARVQHSQTSQQDKHQESRPRRRSLTD